MSEETFSPRSFLKERRPYLFSDSFRKEASLLDRSLLEYHLESLTSRSQENDFQEFARRLAAVEICPNLLPQTGPTGGGDSKVDSETFPVADSLALAWYVGTAREGATERWGFAMSAKREWRSKLREDVAKIVATGRGYAKAFFITSRYVRDRDRAALEDELTKKHGIDVRILDRTWILDRVFNNRREQLAIDILKIETATQTDVQQGPRDVQREQEQSEIELRIEQRTQEEQFVPGLVDDCLKSALLARGLERPRTEIDGRFIRAQRIAEKCGTPHQQLLVAYNWAWTAYFWYEDYHLFARFYPEVESRALGTTNPYELELLSNLWKILVPVVRSNQLDSSTIDFDARTEQLSIELERLAQDEQRASAALQAKSLQLTMQLLLAAPADKERVFVALKDVVEQAQNLIGFPLQPLCESIFVIGSAFDNSAEYQSLFDFLVETTATREGETAAARLLLRRGQQQIAGKHPSEAIRTIGRALVRLFKHENRFELVLALYLMSISYERLGLLWAARGMLLAASSIAAHDLWIHGEVTPLQAACFNRLKWLELQLGRVPQVLTWHELDLSTRGALHARDVVMASLDESEEDYDAILGSLLLRSRLDQLKRLGRLPTALENLALFSSAAAVTFALGHEDKLPAELGVDLSDSAAICEFFEQWCAQPAAADLPIEPSFCDTPEVTLRSIVLGCTIVITAENRPACIAVAESALGATESLLATGVVDRLIALEPKLIIDVRIKDQNPSLFDFVLSDQEGLPHLQIGCLPFDPNNLSSAEQQEVKTKLVELLATIMARICPVEDFEQRAAKMFGEEKAIERSVNFACSFVVLGNVLGNSQKAQIDEWLLPDAEDLALTRSAVWNTGRPSANNAKDNSISQPPKPGTGPPPAELLDASTTKHSEVRTVSLIRTPLWEQAIWTGTAFLRTRRPTDPPLLALMFQNEDAAVQIFTNLRAEVGEHDVDERVRVSIIRGIDAGNPHAYRVLIGTNLAAVPAEGLRYVSIGCRANTMAPLSSENLDAFIENYRTCGFYGLGYAVGDGESCSPRFDLVITKREFNVREAWEIGRHDIDSAGIRVHDNPIIPPNQSSPPVFELMEWRRKAPGDF
jgi:hypothetical protein